MKINTNGYRPSHRNRWLLLQHKILTKEELLLFEYYLDQMDFDFRHVQFGTFQVNFSELSQLFGYKVNKSNNSIRSKHNKLLEVGLIYPTRDSNFFAIKNPERYIAETSIWKGKASTFRKNEMDKPTEVVIESMRGQFQSTETEFQSIETKFQPVEKSKPILLDKLSSRALGSSKVESNLIKESEESLAEGPSRTVRTTQGYLDIHKEGGYSTLSPEDMKYLDEQI